MNILPPLPIWVCAFATSLVVGCANRPILPETYIAPIEQFEYFDICHGHGCRIKSAVSLSTKEWARITKPLKHKATSAKQERQHIVQSIALMEEIVGKHTGTEVDLGRASLSDKGGLQLDCIDESINTTRYLQLFENEKLLKFHSVTTPTHRGRLLDGRWPHYAAVLQEETSNNHYVIDSWFFDNGTPPAIVKLEAWLNGWQPHQKTEKN